MIYSHSHVDHFSGVKGVTSQAEVDAGVPVIAPTGFLEPTIAENEVLDHVVFAEPGHQAGHALLAEVPA